MKNSNVIELHHVTKEFSSDSQQTIALRDVSVTIRAGELILVLGPSGSGKTTLLMLMAGLIQPTRGDVVLLGRNITAYPQTELQRTRAQKIGFVFQTFLLMDWLTPEENIGIIRLFSGGRDHEALPRPRELMKQLGIDRLARKTTSTLSQGEKQRVAVARAFANQPEIILADEPTASLDQEQGSQIIRMLHDFARQHNSCVVVASHDIRMQSLADRVLTIENGTLCREGT